MILPQIILKIRSDSSKSFIRFNFSYIILKSFVWNLYAIRMSIECTRISLVCHSCISSMYPFVIRMLLLYVRKSSVCTRILFVCHSYVLICHPYVTRMYSYVVRMSLVCGATMNLFKFVKKIVLLVY